MPPFSLWLINANQDLANILKISAVGPQIHGSRPNYGNREKYQDWLAEGVGFEPTRPFRA